ncbi:methionine gamma-lyase family protein [Ruminococcus sp.]|uniref:methionine gamma-lyase family protein n=1 Tax=Ruminococcus sp. TaxID=41978 RepID=UPI0025E200FD|nr:methionine gamma-lyase family protein [Ruminococcus sp.]MCI5817231.1 methionine gamma-lyase family protein [Ruminococcus sp.]MDD7555673.1 methionine gamma-lyase family protein [Ruminococcus sp.]MDY4963560.1 methionine gamma-lyase family protein [Ruminococcus callidus]
MSDFFRIDPRIMELAKKAEQIAAAKFAEIDANAAYNGEKVLSAFIKNRVSEPCFYGSTGYGYGDIGRETLDKVYAQVLDAEDALVRHTFVSGTHALSVALFGVLRPGDKLLAVTGKPYDTLEEVIGISGTPGNGSLMDYGVEYAEVALTHEGLPDLDAIAQAVPGAKVAYIQRSRGYSLRPAYTVEQIERIVQTVRKVSPDTVIMVDNCYGEFVQRREPTSVGADLIVGSLIKNAGGAIAQTGGYIAGRKDLVELCAYRLTCVGMGKEVGCTLHQNKEMFMGLFFAPDVVANALKTAAFAAELFRLMGFDSYPALSETRGDIITAIRFGTPELLTAFCQGVQKGAPVDAFVTPEPWDMPGYTSQVIMAAGAFTMGASIELSADAPMREPYAVWMQGGITYTSGRIGILLAAQEMLDRGLILKQ